MGKATKYPNQKKPDHGFLVPLCTFKILAPQGRDNVSVVAVWNEHDGSFSAQGMVTSLFAFHNEVKKLHASIKLELKTAGVDTRLWYDPSFETTTVTAVGDKVAFRSSMDFKVVKPSQIEAFGEVVERVLNENYYDQRKE